MRGCGPGYTLIELALAMAIVLICGAVAFAAATEARQLYDSDTARSELNQNLRAVLDMMATEIRQAGERLPGDFPAVELVDNAAGDRLTLRRHLVETVLLSCSDLAASANKIYVALPAGAGNCAIAPDNDADGTPDNIQVYRDHRLAYGAGSSPKILAAGYIYDPTTNQGEFFAFENEEADGGTGDWFLRLSGGVLASAYPAANQPRVYLIEESRYDLTSGTIELRRDGDAANPLAVVDEIVDFRVVLLMEDATTRTSFANTDDWTEIQSVQLQVSAERPVDDRTIARTLDAEAFPRNILSN